jgi:hypothetical protein
MDALVVCYALKAETHIGPVVDRNQFGQDLSYIALAKAEGAVLAHGDDVSGRDTPGFYLAPALFTQTGSDCFQNLHEIEQAQKTYDQNVGRYSGEKNKRCRPMQRGTHQQTSAN